MRISVVIPAHNEAKTLSHCLESLLIQTHRDLEIIVVDDGSIDDTFAVASRYPVRVLRHERCLGEAAARTTGCKAATGDIILHGEADAIYPMHYVETAIRYFSNPEVMALACGEIRVVPEAKGLISDYYRVRRRASYLMRQMGRKPTYGCHLMRRQIFDIVGYYDPECVVGSDADLALRIQRAGLKTVWAQDLFFWHRDPDNLRTFLRRTFKGNLYRKVFIDRWHLRPKRLLYFGFLLWNIAVFVSVLAIPFAVLHAFSLMPALGVGFVEGVGSLVILREYREAFLLALKQKKYLLALLFPAVTFLRVRSASLGLLIADLIHGRVRQSVTFE